MGGLEAAAFGGESAVMLSCCLHLCQHIPYCCGIFPILYEMQSKEKMPSYGREQDAIVHFPLTEQYHQQQSVEQLLAWPTAKHILVRRYWQSPTAYICAPVLHPGLLQGSPDAAGGPALTTAAIIVRQGLEGGLGKLQHLPRQHLGERKRLA